MDVKMNTQKRKDIVIKATHKGNAKPYLQLTTIIHTLARHTARRLGYRFREHLREVERNDKDASKPVVRRFNLPNHSKQHMAVCGLSLHLGSSESRKTPVQIGTLNPRGINERFSFN